jgi:hypothetical protein
LKLTHAGFDDDVKATVRDLFAEQNLGVYSGHWTGVVGLHDVRMVKISPVESLSKYKEWRPWLQHAALHSTIRASVHDNLPTATVGRLWKIARHQPNGAAVE